MKIYKESSLTVYIIVRIIGDIHGVVTGGGSEIVAVYYDKIEAIKHCKKLEKNSYADSFQVISSIVK